MNILRFQVSIISDTSRRELLGSEVEQFQVITQILN